MPKSSKKNADYLLQKAESYISRVYLVKYSDKCAIEEGKEYESAEGREVELKAREDLLKYALNADMPGVSYRSSTRMESMTTFKPFNIKELEVDYFANSQQLRVGFYQREFEKKGLRMNSRSRPREDSKHARADSRDDRPGYNDKDSRREYSDPTFRGKPDTYSRDSRSPRNYDSKPVYREDSRADGKDSRREDRDSRSRGRNAYSRDRDHYMKKDAKLR